MTFSDDTVMKYQCAYDAHITTNSVFWPIIQVFMTHNFGRCEVTEFSVASLIPWENNCSCNSSVMSHIFLRKGQFLLFCNLDKCLVPISIMYSWAGFHTWKWAGFLSVISVLECQTNNHLYNVTNGSIYRGTKSFFKIFSFNCALTSV